MSHLSAKSSPWYWELKQQLLLLVPGVLGEASYCLTQILNWSKMQLGSKELLHSLQEPPSRTPFKKGFFAFVDPMQGKAIQKQSFCPEAWALATTIFLPDGRAPSVWSDSQCFAESWKMQTVDRWGKSLWRLVLSLDRIAEERASSMPWSQVFLPRVISRHGHWGSDNSGIICWKHCSGIFQLRFTFAIWESTT